MRKSQTSKIRFLEVIPIEGSDILLQFRVHEIDVEHMIHMTLCVTAHAIDFPVIKPDLPGGTTPERRGSMEDHGGETTAVERERGIFPMHMIH